MYRIPQDPVLFSGTVRTNLDPFIHHDDARLNEVLERVGLRSVVERVPSSNSLTSLGIGKTSLARISLSDDVCEGGTNFSVGQRQLLVIARALLSKSSERNQIESVEEGCCHTTIEQINADCMTLQSMSTLDTSLQIQDDCDYERKVENDSDLISCSHQLIQLPLQILQMRIKSRIIVR